MMADILIRGMDMPDCCEKCPFLDYEQGYCFASGKKQKNGWYYNGFYASGNKNKRHDDCPLIALPKEHGRLIDGDELASGCDEPFWCRWLSEIEDAPTIVPAEMEIEDTPTEKINTSTDCVSRQAAIDAFWSLDVELRPSTIDAILNTLNGLPSAQSEISRIEQELHGKTPEEQYEFLCWLMLNFALTYTDSRLAVVEWLRGEEEDGRFNQQAGCD